MEEEKQFWPEACPACGSIDGVMKVIFGMGDDDDDRLVDQGKAFLVGCVYDCITGPHWHCRSCEHGWQDERDPRHIELREIGWIPEP
jgi:hypothetical protein